MSRKLKCTIVFVLAIALLSSCGKDDELGRGEALDIVFYAFNSEPILNWDPSVMFSNGIVVLNNVYETLLTFDANTKAFDYVLATDYTKSADGLKWTFTLREGVQFHDGEPFNAEAVKFSVNRTKDMGQGAAYIWDSVESVEVVDAYTVVFNLSYQAPLDLIVSSPYAAFMMSPAIADKDAHWFGEGNEAGTGPYQLESTRMGDEVILTAFDAYWGGWDGSHFQKAVIKKIPETSSRRQMVEKGDADITYNLPSEDVEALKTMTGVEVMPEGSFTNLLGFFNTEKAPLDDIRVRQALSYAFPYQDVIDYAAGGYATQAMGVIPAGHWGRGTDLFQYTKDLEKAGRLLGEVGIKEGELNLLLTYMSGDEVEKKSAELYKAELSKIGVNLEIRAMPWETQWEMAMDSDPENRQDIFFMYWWPDTSSPYSWMNSLFHSEEQILFNMAYYQNDAFDAIIDEGYELSGQSIEAAEVKFVEAQKMLIEEAPTLFIMDKMDVWVLNSSLKGFNYNPSYTSVVKFYECYRAE